MSENRNYVAGWHDYGDDCIVILERDENGSLFKKKYNCPYYFYVPNVDGEYTSLYGDKLKRLEFETKQEYDTARRMYPIKFESDFTPLKRILMDVYRDRPTPKVNFALLDIEVDYNSEDGFAGPKNPYGIINAVTVYQSWTGKYLLYAVPPKVDGKCWAEREGNSAELIYKLIDDLIAKGQLRDKKIPEITICRDESELVQRMLGAISEADIISGWNSEFYDIPYIAERLLLLGGESMLARLEVPGARLPRKETANKFGTEEPVYRFSGRCHLDYMQLFKKFTFEGRVSYSLGNILQEEVGVGKLEYSGSLEQLYNQDFPLFCAYNFRDVDGLVQLDDKFKFIQTANQMAHESTVLFDSVLGTVAYVETAITNHAHSAMNLIVADKVIVENEKVEGAIVMTPRIGLHEQVGSVDLKSLYPNTIRALNISPEKIIGQFVEQEDDWRAIRQKKTDVNCTLILESGEQVTKSASEWKKVLKELKWAISAYGTVFDQGKGRGIIPDILRFWYTERKRLQAENKKWIKISKELPDGPEKDEAIRKAEHFDLLQLTKKISMNSLYGALLNKAFRFGDQRLGASVTATGRQITTHMIETIGELLTGVRHPLLKRYKIEDDDADLDEYVSAKDNIYKNSHTWDAFVRMPEKGILGVHSAHYGIASDAIIYGDTDSCYFKTYGKSNEEAIQIADFVSESTNNSFPPFMREAFNCQEEYDELIGASREIVGSRGLFLAKKKYVIKVYDQDGFSVNKIKSMGSEIKKADTPKIIQKFLKDTVEMILDGIDYDTVCNFVIQQRKTVLKNKLNVFALGVAKQVNNLDKYYAEYLAPGTHATIGANGKKRNLTIPGHARAACNYNVFIIDHDKGARAVVSGDKVLVFYLRQNAYHYNAIAFPAEYERFPSWFNETFSVDLVKTENKMFDNKLAGIFAALGKDVPTLQSVYTNKILGF